MFKFSQLGIPIIQAPMAGGPNTPQLASAVANAGGVGSFGFTYDKPEKIDENLRETKALTNGYINANFFVFKPESLPDKEIQLAAIEAIRSLPIKGEFSVKIPSEPYYPDIEELLIPVWDHRPAILTFHFGIPSQNIVQKARSLGISVGITATNINEALAIDKSGANFIIAQGIEAGGHRGVFEPEEIDEETSLDNLIIKLTKESSLPIIAAGGIMSGIDINRVLKIGATAAQMGTAFLCCEEAGTTKAHKEFLLNKKDRETSYTKAFSGRRAQGINNQFIKLMENKTVLPFPLQNTMTGTLRKLAAINNDGDYQSLWAGKSFDKIRAMPAEELMLALYEEMKLADS